MAINEADRQKNRHQKMLDKGFKRRAFYLDEETMQMITEYKEKHKLESLDVAIQQMVKNSKTALK